jgi:predicted phosphodiesterase
MASSLRHFAVYRTSRGNPNIHLGDTTADARHIALQSGLPVTAVLGNNDRGEPEPSECKVVFGGVKMLLMHGHTDLLSGACKCADGGSRGRCRYAMFGHTHFFYYRVHEGLHVLNRVRRRH